MVQLGGTLRHSSLSVVGKYAESALKDFSCSKLFLGVDGIDLDFGITTTDIREAELNKEMMHSAQKTIVLADSSKFRRRGFSKIANMDEIDLIITDSNISDKISQRIEEVRHRTDGSRRQRLTDPYSGKRGATGLTTLKPTD